MGTKRSRSNSLEESKDRLPKARKPEELSDNAGNSISKSSEQSDWPKTKSRPSFPTGLHQEYKSPLRAFSRQNQQQDSGSAQNPKGKEQKTSSDKRIDTQAGDLVSSQSEPAVKTSTKSLLQTLYETPTVTRMNELYPEIMQHTSSVNVTPSTSTPASVKSSRLDLPPLPATAPGQLSTAPFTHGSCGDAKYQSKNNVLNYERLEFLGDAYIEVFAVRLIYTRFPDLLVGKQNIFREELTRNSTLASYARGYGFYDRLQGAFGGGNSMPNKKTREKIEADVFEAYVAAVVLSDPVNGFATAEAWMIALWAPVVLEVADGKRDIDITGMKQNWKDILLSKVGGPSDFKMDFRDTGGERYNEDRSQQLFPVALYLSGWGYENIKVSEAVAGPGKKDAQMMCARKALRTDLVKKMMGKKEEAVEEKKKRKLERLEAEKREKMGGKAIEANCESSGQS